MTQQELELELEAEKLYPVNKKGSMWMPNRDEVNNSYKQEGFIAGATTSKYVEKQKLEFAIEQLNKLDSILQAKYEVLSNMQQEYLGKMKETQLANKKSGLRLAKEEIRRDIKELQQQLSEL